MFTHLENDLCRTIFVLIYLIYVKMLHNFQLDWMLLFIAAKYKVSCDGGSSMQSVLS